jgi:hypothetical protein
LIALTHGNSIFVTTGAVVAVLCVSTAIIANVKPAAMLIATALMMVIGIKRHVAVGSSPALAHHCGPFWVNLKPPRESGHH